MWCFKERLLKVLNCYNFLWVQQWHKWSPAASYANCVMKPNLLKVHPQTLPLVFHIVIDRQQHYALHGLFGTRKHFTYRYATMEHKQDNTAKYRLVVNKCSYMGDRVPFYYISKEWITILLANCIQGNESRLKSLCQATWQNLSQTVSATDKSKKRTQNLDDGLFWNVTT